VRDFVPILVERSAVVASTGMLSGSSGSSVRSRRKSGRSGPAYPLPVRVVGIVLAAAGAIVLIPPSPAV
jgi:hypothetical protein